MLILGLFHVHGMKIHVAFEWVGCDEKFNDAKGAQTFIALLVT